MTFAPESDRAAWPVPDPERRPLNGKTIVLGVGGSISAYKAADLCSKLVQDGARVFPILTRGALRFVGAATFWGLAAQPVATDAFDQPFGPGEIAHLHYAEVADLFVIAPASADLLARLAAGLADDMLGSALLGNRARPVLICPAMNTDMWTHPATQANRRTLEGWGYRFLDPGVGRLAEGVVGAGRLAEPTDIVRAIRETLLPARDLAGLSVLVTAGPTREALDPVRFLSNRSSGKMGYAVAEAAAARGATVTLVSGPSSLPVPAGVAGVVRVTSAAQMLAACRDHAPAAHVIVAAAAVADYAPLAVAEQKIKKTAAAGDDALTLTLRPTPDILRRLGQEKRPGQALVGFAAETENVDQNARAKLRAKNLDLIVANDVTRPGAGFDGDTNIVTLIGADGAATALPQMTKRQVADALLDRVAALRLRS